MKHLFRLITLVGGVWIALLSFAACDPISVADDVETPVVAPKLVLQALLCPQDSVQSIHVLTTLPLNADLEEYYRALDKVRDPWQMATDGIIPSALVRITNLETQAELTVPFQFDTLCYTFRTKEFPLREGTRYRINVDFGSYPPLEEEVTITAATRPEVEILNQSLATFIRLYVPREPLRYFCVYTYTTRDDGWGDRVVAKVNYLSSETSHDGVLTLRSKSRFNPFGAQQTPPKLDSVTIYEIDGRTYRYFQALNKNEEVGDNPFASPAILENYVKNGFGLVAPLWRYERFIP